jgi:hypothetical protein
MGTKPSFRCALLELERRGTFRPFAHAAIADAASLRGCGMLAFALQPNSPERSFKTSLNHEIQAVVIFGFLEIVRFGNIAQPYKEAWVADFSTGWIFSHHVGVRTCAILG